MDTLETFKPDVEKPNSDSTVEYKILETVSPFRSYDKGDISSYTGLEKGGTHHGFIEATNKCKRKIRVLNMYSELKRTLNFNTPGFVNHA